jgi:hypothetical protein
MTMEMNAFFKSIDRSHLDKLQKEILAYAVTFKEKGYHNMDIARTLVEAGLSCADETQSISISLSFHQHVRDVCIRHIADLEALGRENAAQAREEKKQ